MFARLLINDFDWVKDYQNTVPEIIRKHGGRLLARTPEAEVIEGDVESPNVVLLVDFLSKEAANGFYNSEEYRSYLEVRLRGSKSELHNFKGKDSFAPKP